MAEELIGEPLLRLKADHASLKADLEKAKAAVKSAATDIDKATAQGIVKKLEEQLARVGSALNKAENQAAKSARAIQKSIDYLNATKANQAMVELTAGVEKLGGVAALSSSQVDQLRKKVESLKGAGAAIPKSLAGVVPGEGGALKQAGLSALTAEAQSAAGPLGPLAGVIGSLGPAGIAAAAGLGLATGAVVSFVKTAGEIQDLSDKTKLSTDFLQELGYAGSFSGVGMEEAGNAALALSQNIAQGDPVFKQLGLNLEELRDLSPDEQFRRVADAIAAIEDPALQTDMALKAFGGRAKEILPILRNGFSDLADEAHRYGAILSSDAIARGDDLGDNWTRLTNIGGAWLKRLGDITAQTALVGIASLQGAAGLAKLNAEAEKRDGGQASGPGGATKKAIAGVFSTPSITGADPAKAADEMEAAEQRLATAKKFDKEAQDDLTAAVKAFTQEQTQALTQMDNELAKRREQRETFGLLGKSAEDASVQMGMIGLQAERFGGVSALSDAQLKKLVSDLQALQAEGGSNAFGLDTLNEGLDETAKRSGAMAKEQFGLRELGNVIPESTGLWTRYGDVVDQELQNASDQTKKVTKETVSWASQLQNIANMVGSMGGAGGLFGKLLGGTAGIGSLFDKDKGIFGKGLGAGFKDSEGKLGFGSLLKGVSGVGTAIMAGLDIGKAIFSAFKKPEWKKIMGDVGKKWGVDISEGLAKQIESDSKQLGDRVAAELKNLPAIIDEAGGVAAFGFDKATSAAHDLFSQIETGKLSVADAGQAFDKVFAQLIPEAIDKTTGLAKKSFLDLIELDKKFGTKSAAVAGFIADQNDKIVTGLQAVVAGMKASTEQMAKGGGPSTLSQRSAGGVGAAIAAAFQQLRDQGLSAKEALDKLAPTISDFQASLDAANKAAGGAFYDGGAAFAFLAAQAALYSDEVAGPLVSAINGAGQALAGFQNTGALTPEIFQGLTASITDTVAKLEAEGKSGPALYAAIGQDLQTVWELQQDYGYAVDASTQALLDQAQAAGVVGEAHRSAQEKMAAATEHLDLVLTAIAEKMGVDLPAAAEKGAAGVQAALDGIKPPNIPGVNMGGGAGVARGEPPPGSGMPHYALGGWVPDTGPAMLHRGEYVETAAQAAAGGRIGQVDAQISFGPFNVSGADKPEEWARRLVDLVDRDPRVRDAVTRLMAGKTT